MEPGKYFKDKCYFNFIEITASFEERVYGFTYLMGDPSPMEKNPVVWFPKMHRWEHYDSNKHQASIELKKRMQHQVSHSKMVQ